MLMIDMRLISPMTRLMSSQDTRVTRHIQLKQRHSLQRTKLVHLFICLFAANYRHGYLSGNSVKNNISLYFIHVVSCCITFISLKCGK